VVTPTIPPLPGASGRPRGQRYRDSEAAIEHAANLGDLFPAILATVSVVHGELLREPSAELRANLADSDVPVLFTP
jgi:hypothetical protein